MKPLSTVMQILLALVGTYLAVCTLLWAFQGKLIFHPRAIAVPPSNPAAEPIEIDRGDAMLRGWIVNARSDGPLVVYYGGNAEEVSVNIDNWAGRPATTVLVNYRGFGHSTGTPSERVLLEDAVATVEWARERYSHRPLVLFGLSLGSGIAVLTATRVKPDAVILVSPYRSVEHIARRRLPIIPVRQLLRHRFDAHTAARALPRALVIASPRDRVIPYEENLAMVDAINAAASRPVVLHTFELPHHGFLHHPPVWRTVDEFLATIPSRGDGNG